MKTIGFILVFSSLAFFHGNMSDMLSVILTTSVFGIACEIFRV